MIGFPVRHSLSPAIHNAAFGAVGLDWVFGAFEVAPGSGAAAVAGARALGLAGLSVTMPHKDAAASAVDRCSSVADALGAVNTVSWRGDELFGDNTDGAGFLDALRLDEGFDPEGRRCVVVGAGGAARAVVHALGGAGAADIAVVNRSAERAHVAAALSPAARVAVMGECGEADLIVNATPVGMGADGNVAVDPAHLGPGQLVVDLVYRPAITPLVDAARAAGATAVNGIGMLIHQAAHAFRQWTGEDPPLEVMSAAALAALAAEG